MEVKIQELENIAREILSKAEKIKKNNSATLLTLSGTLGAGKTTLSQEIGKILGVTESIISPTFVIMKKYKINNKKYKWLRLIHIDLYRLKNSNELRILGWQELLTDQNNLVIVEWPEQVPGAIPEHALNIKLDHKDEETRKIKF